jgi:hypothetical protein
MGAREFFNSLRLIFTAVLNLWICFGYRGWTDFDSGSAHLDRRFVLGTLCSVGLVLLFRVLRTSSFLWKKCVAVLLAIVPGFGFYMALVEIHGQW